MKRFSIIIIIAAFGLGANAQKCKYDINQSDPFTNESVKSTTFKLGPKEINNKKNYEVGWTITLEKNGKDNFISFKVIMFGKFDEGIANGQKLYLKLENGEIITLVADKDIIPAYMTGIAVYTHYDLRYKVDSSVLQKLSISLITNMKVELVMDKSITALIDDGKAKKIMQSANCFL